MSEWQPIETAPADGKILCWSAAWHTGPRFLWRYTEHPRTRKPQWEDEHELDEWPELEESPPTHWMPLPAPPSQP